MGMEHKLSVIGTQAKKMEHTLSINVNGCGTYAKCIWNISE